MRIQAARGTDWAAELDSLIVQNESLILVFLHIA